MILFSYIAFDIPLDIRFPWREYPNLENIYPYAAIATGIVVLFLWSRTEQFLGNHEYAYLEYLQNEMGKRRVKAIEVIFGSTNPEKINDIYLDRLQKGEIGREEYLAGIGMLYFDKGQLEKAFQALDERRKLFSKDGMKENITTYEALLLAQTNLTLGRISEINLDTKKALKYYSSADELCDSYYVKHRISQLTTNGN